MFLYDFIKLQHRKKVHFVGFNIIFCLYDAAVPLIINLYTITIPSIIRESRVAKRAELFGSTVCWEVGTGRVGGFVIYLQTFHLFAILLESWVYSRPFSTTFTKTSKLKTHFNEIQLMDPLAPSTRLFGQMPMSSKFRKAALYPFVGLFYIPGSFWSKEEDTSPERTADKMWIDSVLRSWLR